MTHAVRVTSGIKFGEGGVGFDRKRGAAASRDLLLDHYEPIDGPRGERPALIMAFGGALNRGSRKDDLFGEPGHVNTPVYEYCRRFAARGYACFSIDYRLMQEAPDPGGTPVVSEDVSAYSERVDHVRSLLGLPPSTQQMIIDAIEAGTDDMAKAIGFVRDKARRFGVDAARIGVYQ